MTFLDGGILVGGDTPTVTPIPTTAVPILSVPITIVGGFPVMTLPENYAEYNLLGFTYIENTNAIIPYALDLNYIKEHATLAIAPDYFAAEIQWDRTARTLTGVDYATFHNAFLYTGVGDSSGDGMVTPIETPRTVKGQHVATLGISGTFTGYEQFGGWDLINPVQTWTRFEHENYLGTHHADPVIISGTHQIGHFYYRTSDNQWRGIFQNGGLAWEDWNLRAATGVDLGSDRGAFDSESEANDDLFTPETLVNWAFFDGHYWVYGGFRLLDGLLHISDTEDGISDAIVNLPVTLVSDAQLGYLLELYEGEIVRRSYFLPQGNKPAADLGAVIDGNTLYINFFDFQITTWLSIVGDDPVTIETPAAYELRLYIAEN